MINIEKVHLYVEKFDRLRQELLLDFVREDEFVYFKNRGDYTPEMHLSEEYEPTMLLFYGCSPKKTLWHGAILTLDMNRLIEMYSKKNLELNENAFERSATIFLEILDGTYLADLIDDPDSSSVSTQISEEYIMHLNSSWEGAPCALTNLEEKIEITVWDVGQGNTNCISDKTNLTIFDFGTSFYYSKTKQNAILNAHKEFIKGHDRVSLIISHWDIDHYNLLCVASDEFLENICCIFYPSVGIGLTMAQVAARIQKNCCYRRAIVSSQKTSRRCGIQKVCEGDRYALFIGEESKNKNNSGLLLSIFNDKATAFLTADHSNHQVWNCLFASAYTGIQELHIVVPHHGGDCGRTAIPNEIIPGVGAVSVGSNLYGHPKPKTISAYRTAGFKVMQTDRYGQDIVIKM